MRHPETFPDAARPAQTPERALGIADGGPVALFLDLDGTLADIQAAPEQAHIDADTLAALVVLTRHLDGALAIVSGRPLAQVDAMLAPEIWPAAGIHGAERRDAQGRLHAPAYDAAAVLARKALTACAGWSGVRVEPKAAAVAIHFRAAPERESECQALALALAADQPGWLAMSGKCVVEIKPAQVDKGRAMLAFLSEPPFTGRQPLFVGDDVTDEAGFVAARSAGGRAVKVGPGPTQADLRLPGPADVRTWLRRWSASGDASTAFLSARGESS